MSLQGPLLVVADAPATAPVEALSAAGAFPIVETTWADAPNRATFWSFTSTSSLLPRSK